MKKLTVLILVVLSAPSAFASTTICNGFCVRSKSGGLIHALRRSATTILGQGENEASAIANLKTKCSGKNTAVVSALDFYGGSSLVVLTSKDSSAAVSLGASGAEFSCVAI